MLRFKDHQVPLILFIYQILQKFLDQNIYQMMRFFPKMEDGTRRQFKKERVLRIDTGLMKMKTCLL